MTDRSDTEVDLHPTDPADIAILNMDIAAANDRVAAQLVECEGDPLRAFNFDWLSLNPDVLWLQRKLHVNFKQHPSCLLKVVNSIHTWAIDYDTIQDWTQKTAHFWTNANGKYRRHQALLLCYGRNRSGLQPPDDNGLIYSGAVIWVFHNQSCVTVPQAIQHIRAMAVPQREEMAVLCSIPDSPPYWVSPDDTSKFNLVQLDNNIGTWVTHLNRVRSYRCITLHLQSTMRTFIALDRGVSGRDDIKADDVAFYYVEPRGALWPCTVYAVTNNDGDLLPALNVIPLETSDEMAPPPPPVPPQEQYPPPNPDLKQDVIQMMGPTVGQLEHHIVDDSSDTEEQPATDAPTQAPRTPDGAPSPPPPEAPSQHVIIKTEDTEEGAASDTTFNESMDSSAQPVIPHDYTYLTITIQAPDGANDTTQEPASSTSNSRPPAPLGTPSRTVIFLADAERVNLLCSLPQEIIQHSAVLDAAYNDLMAKFFDKLKITHAERLSDLDACRTSVSNAVREWTAEVQTRSSLLGSNPGAATYNIAIDTVRLLSNTLRHNVDKAENTFLASQTQHDARVEQHATEVKEMLEDGIQEAIQVFLRGCVGSSIRYVGAEGNLDPWLTQFSTRAMDFQSRVLARTAEFYDLPMDLRTAAVSQQLDMFLVTARMLPATCPLSYPVLTPRSQAMLPPTPVGETGKGRGAKPNAKSITGASGSSSTEPPKPRKPVPTPTSKATATSCHAGGVGGPTVALQDVPGSYSYTSIISRGFTPSSAEHLPVAERATTFGVTTPPAITRVTGGRAPPVLIQTVTPSTTTATITPAILTSTSGPQRPIDCKLLGAKCHHNPTPPKMAEPTPDPNTLDHEPAPIPVVILDDED